MSNDVNLLIYQANSNQMFCTALKLNTSMINFEEVKYWAEPENTKKIFSFLPYHCQSFGNIIKVEEIFEVKDLTK